MEKLETAKDISLGPVPRIGNEIWQYNTRAAEALDVAEIEIISVNGQPFEKSDEQ